ncbi:MAG: hypothetical protein U0401_20205 [Anaerolineae bacterium]
MAAHFGAGLELRQHCPATLRAYDALTEPIWYEILAYLLNQVEEQEWFEVDWNVLNMAWAWWMEGEEDNEGDQGNALAAFLIYIPVKRYGFSQSDLPTQSGRWSCCTLCYHLTCRAVHSSLLVALEIYDQPFEEVKLAEQAVAWRFYGRWSRTLLLPGAGTLAAGIGPLVGHITHNPILDMAAGADHLEPATWPPSRFTSGQ